MTRKLQVFTLLVCCYFASETSLLLADEPVVWTNLVNASASGSDLTKTGGTTAWDAGGASVQVIRDGYGYVEFTMPNTSTYRFVGLSNGDPVNLDYGLLVRSDASVGIYEAGTYRGEFGSYVSNDRFRVEVRYGVVRYLRNGTLLYTSPSVPKYPLRVDASLYNPGATVTNVRISNLVWTGGSGVSVTGDSLTKTGAAGWNAGAISTNTIEAGNGYVEFTATETNKNRAAGLGNGDTNQTLADIEFGVILRSDGNVEVSESGTSRGTFGAYLAGDRIRVELSGGTIRYYRNGATFYTSGVTPSYPLRADSSLDTAGATITNLSLETLIWSTVTGVSTQGATITKTAAGGSWNAAASSSQIISASDGWVEFTAIETNTRRVLGLKGTGAATTYADIDFAIDLTDTATVQVYELGTLRGQFGSYAHGDRLRIEIQDGIVQYRKNGTILYTSTVTPGYPLHAEAALYTNGATIVDVAMGNIVWINEVGLQMRGHTLVKNNPTGTSGAVSTRAIQSGYVEFTTSETNAERIIGLSKGDSSLSYTDIDYGILLRPTGVIAIYESGTLRNEFGSAATGDRLRVELQSGGTVRYLKNGTVIYTSTVAPTLPLRIDTAIYPSTGILFNVVFSGVVVTEELDMPTIAPAAGQYLTTQNVTMSHWLSGATIRYTTDGTDPTTTSTTYASAINVDQTTTVKAKAWKTVYTPSNVRTAVYTLKVVTPSFSPVAGTYNTSQTVTISTTTPSTTIRFTTDGSTPNGSSPLYTTPVTVDQTLTLKAIAFRSGWTDSDVGSAAYTMQVGALSFNPVQGAYSGVQTVTVTTVTPNVTFRYTLDGSEPTSSSPAASGNTVTVDQSTTLKVEGFRTGWTASAINRASYWINLGTVATPTLSPTAGTYTTAQNVTITSATSGATIRYTTDGTEPNARSPVYMGPLAVSRTADVRAKAFKADMTASSTSAGLFVIDTGAVDTPRFSPGSGTYSTYQTVTVTSQTTGATIHYRTDGQDPTEADPVVASGGTVTVNQSMTLTAKAWKNGVPTSDTSRGAYWITGSVAAGADTTSAQKESFSIALQRDGTVWTWGSNSSKQLGRTIGGSFTSLAGQISGLTDIVAVAAGELHALALKRNGDVWAWGSGVYGQLGNGSSTTPNSPVQTTITGVVAIAAGKYHSLAVKADGTVWIWGQLTDPQTNYGNVPVQVAGLSGITQVAASANTSFAIKTDSVESGTVWGWGTNANGQLGDGTSTSRATPVRVVGLSDATTVSAGPLHTMVAKTDGTVWNWGKNAYGGLGNGTTTDSVTTVLAALLYTAKVMSLTAGYEYSLAMQRPSVGTAVTWAWGANFHGEFGNGTMTNSNLPMQSLLADGVIVSAAYAHVLGITSDSRVWAWGANGMGMLGDETTTTRTSPVLVHALMGAVASPLNDDPDQDGLPTRYELELGTDPWTADSNGDGIPDGTAVSAGISPTKLDPDADGVSNALEITRGTDPFRADTDSDGANDLADCFPLDSTRAQQCPAPNPSDTTPPTITLTEPTNATLVGTNP